MKLRLLAPAKVNYTLEVLGRRADGYHEVRTVLQTLDIADRVLISDNQRLELKMGGRMAGESALPVEDNLALRAARALQQAARIQRRGALIEIEKQVPVAAGLGGGSSDAAAVLRGLNVLWRLDLPREDLAFVAASVGSDVPFFVYGGTAQAGGRGESIAPLTDAPSRRLLIVLPPLALEEKTKRMYALLRPEHYSNGGRTRVLTEKIRRSMMPADDDLLNVFEGVVPEIAPSVSEAIASVRQSGAGNPHLSGSGPAFFFLLDDGGPPDALLKELERLGLPWLTALTLARDAATVIEREA